MARKKEPPLETLASSLKIDLLKSAVLARQILHDMLSDSNLSAKDKINIAQDLLDRAGYKNANSLDVSIDETVSPFRDLTVNELKMIVERLQS